jgi:hypothetical protein
MITDHANAAKKRPFLTVAVLVAGVLARVFPVLARDSILSQADEAFLRDQARRIADSAALAPGQRTGEWSNKTSFRMRVPGGNMGYPAFWVRDSVMMLGGDLIPMAEVEDWIRLIAGTMLADPWQVRPGVVVPAYAVPDHINFDGRPTFYPGNYETGDKQGGKPWGKYPPLDDHFYFLIAVHQHWKMTHGDSLFNSMVKTSFGEIKLSDLCEKAFRVAPSDPETGLVISGAIETENAKDWGFCDGVYKNGKLLFPSVLKFIAAGGLAEMFQAIGRQEKSRGYREEARRIAAAIPATFLRCSSAHPDEGWLHSATGVGNQPDVWGSAFAVWSGALDGPTADLVSRALVRAYREKTAVREGCVRQILTTDPLNAGGWENSVVSRGEYQNGGYWGTPAGWYITALARKDRTAAQDMARDYVGFLRNHMRSDGMAEAWEWFGDRGKNSNPLYVATVALPYLSLLEAGLLDRADK